MNYLRVIALFLFGILSSLSFAMADNGFQPPIKTCVLTFEREGNPITQGVIDTFHEYSRATIKSEAVPTDILNCIQGGYDEIILIAHAFEIQGEATLSGEPLVKLGYFIKENNLAANDNHQYSPAFFYDHVFALADSLLAQQEHMGTKTLKRIRFMACDPNTLAAEYPSFQKMLTNHSVALDIAPTAWFLSLFEDVPVAGFDSGWLAKSIDCLTLTHWKTDQNAYCESDSWPSCDRKTAQYCMNR